MAMNSERNKRRRLRKPIRIALKIITYVVIAAAMDLATISTFLYWLGSGYLLCGVGTSLLINVILEYLFFRNEMCEESTGR